MTNDRVDFICLQHLHPFMRRVLLVAIFLIIVQPISSGTEISSDENYDSNGSLEGNYTVKSGSTLTVSGDYVIEENSKFIVEEGAELLVTGYMNASAPPKLNLAENANVSVPVGFLGETGVMRIIFEEEVLYGISIEIKGEVTENWTGNEFDWTGDMDVENITVNITSNPFQISSISSIILSPQGDTPVIRSVDELSGEGISLVIPDRNGAWTIEVYGTLSVEGSIFGAGITCYGTCALNGATMLSTGPIEVFGSISVTDSYLAGGITDEDIIIWDDADVSWDNSQGTGGVTDNWVNILTTRTVGVQNGYVTFYGYNLGYDNTSTSPLGDNNTFNPDNQGDNTIEIASNERARMVRWQDGNGALHEEQASGLVVLSTPWGDYEHHIDDLPKVNHFDVTLELPMLNFDSLVESDSESNTNTRLGVMATVSNSGNVPAQFLIDCLSNGTDANVGSTVAHSIEGGESKEIPLNWDSPVEGDLSLECSIFVPYHFDGYDVVDKLTASSGVVEWSEEEEEGSNLVIPIVLGLVLGLLIFVVVYMNYRNRDDSYAVDYENKTYEDDEIGTIQ